MRRLRGWGGGVGIGSRRRETIPPSRNMAHVRQSRSNGGVSFQVEAITTFQVAPSQFGVANAVGESPLFQKDSWR